MMEQLPHQQMRFCFKSLSSCKFGEGGTLHGTVMALEMRGMPKIHKFQSIKCDILCNFDFMQLLKVWKEGKK